MLSDLLRTPAELKQGLSWGYNKIQKKIIRRRFHHSFSKANHCYISQNCIGGKLYELQGRTYTTPTVGLWFEPSDFLTFCEHLGESLESEIISDLQATKTVGYPVGRIGDIKIFFQHYATFEEARTRWIKRASRVSIDNVFFLMTDRDGFTEDDLARFCNLRTQRKILFSHIPIPQNDRVVYVPGFGAQGFVGDLYTSYHEFNRSVVRRQLFSILANN